MTKAEILSDLNYVKSMAEEGRNAPLLGGRMGLWWGGLLCLTLFTHWLIITGRTGLPAYSLGLLWMSFGVFGVAGSFLLGQTLRSKPGASSAGNRAEAAVWTGSAIFLLSFGFAAATSAALGYTSFNITNLIMPIAFGVYGLAYFVIAKLSGETRLLAPSFLAFAIMAVSLFMLNSPQLFLVSILGVVLTVIIPSLISLRREPSDVV